MTRRIEGHGIAVELPDRWEARLYLRPDPAAFAAAAAATTVHPSAYGAPGERVHPVLHLANFPLPAGRGDFGTGAVELMRETHAFVALTEYGEEEAHRPLFRSIGRPRLRATDFAPNALQRKLRGQLGVQRFFTEQDRPFCVYAVLGGSRHAEALVAQVNGALDQVAIQARSAVTL